MNSKLMILPSKGCSNIHLLRIPDDVEGHEAYRHVVGLIASIEDNQPNYNWDDILDVLEEHGFESVSFILGPTIDNSQQIYHETA